METESKIQKELGRLTEKKTTFIIAHRISSVREANLIDDGKRPCGGKRYA